MIILNNESNRVFTDSQTSTPNLEPRQFKVQDVSECNNVNDILSFLDVKDYSKEDIPNVCKGYSRILDDRGCPLAIVKDTYDLLNPVEAFAFMDALVSTMGLDYRESGFTHEGKRLFITAYGKPIQISHKDRKLGDTLQTRVTCVTSFDGSSSTIIKIEFLRVICSNKMASWMTDEVIKVRHTRNQRAIMSQALSQATGIEMIFSKIEDDINHLNNVNVSRGQMRKMANKYFKIDGKHDDDIPTKSKNGRDRMLSQFHHETLGTFGQTAWDAMNAYTAYMSHDRPTRNTKGASKEENQWRGAFSEKDSRKFRNIITEVVGA
jgi:hypothetical protein